MDEGKRSKEYNKGYEDAEKDLLDKENVKLFTEGYKAGFRDGYQAARSEMQRLMMDKVPPEIQKQMEEGGQGIWWPW
jgi:flagellar biosynthesis/type III secretory pathway protein FliH